MTESKLATKKRIFITIAKLPFGWFYNKINKINKKTH